MFAPITLRDLTIPNRVVVSPMCMYSAKDGTVNDFALVHLGSRAVGGAGLVITEMTDVLPEGRISLHCAGMYKPEHVDAWRRIVDFIHQHSHSKVAIQLAHAGRKGSLTRNWEGHQNLGTANWELLAPSAIPFMEGRQTPRAMNRADMDTVRDAFVRATEMSEAAGFDMIELHFAHGYLMSSFISPASNRRTDEYGGSLENRMRFPLEVFHAVRAAWPQGKPISPASRRSTGSRAAPRSRTPSRSRACCTRPATTSWRFRPAACRARSRSADGRSYQAVFSDRIRNTLKIPTMSVGGIVSHGDANTIIGAGRADMVRARPRLSGGCLFRPPRRARAELRWGHGRSSIAAPPRFGCAVRDSVKLFFRSSPLSANSHDNLQESWISRLRGKSGGTSSPRPDVRTLRGRFLVHVKGFRGHSARGGLPTMPNDNLARLETFPGDSLPSNAPRRSAASCRSAAPRS